MSFDTIDHVPPNIQTLALSTGGVEHLPNAQTHLHSSSLACDQRLARFICYIHCTVDNRQHCHVGDQVDNCMLGLCCILGDKDVGANFLNVQQANSSFSQQHDGKNHFSGFWSATGSVTALSFLDCVVDVLAPAGCNASLRTFFLVLSNSRTTMTFASIPLVMCHPTLCFAASLCTWLCMRMKRQLSNIFLCRSPKMSHVSRTHRVDLD